MHRQFGHSIHTRGLYFCIPRNCLGGVRPAIFRSTHPREFYSALRCPRPLNPAPPPLPGQDRPCTCPRCRDWVVRDGRRVFTQPLLGAAFGLRPRRILDEAACDGVRWFLISYWDCVNLDWVPSYLRSSYPDWPDEPDGIIDCNHMVSLCRVKEPIHWIWVVLNFLVLILSVELIVGLIIPTPPFNLTFTFSSVFQCG